MKLTEEKKEELIKQLQKAVFIDLLNHPKRSNLEDWDKFYLILDFLGYEIGGKYNWDILRNGVKITDFDPVEDADSGEIEETLQRLKDNDPDNFII